MPLIVSFVQKSGGGFNAALFEGVPWCAQNLPNPLTLHCAPAHSMAGLRTLVDS